MIDDRHRVRFAQDNSRARQSGSIRLERGMDQIPWQVGEFRAPVADIVAIGIELAPLNGGIEDPKKGRGISSTAGDPLPSCSVVGEVGIDQCVPEPGRPILPQQDRALLLAALGCVDHIVVFEDTTPTATLALVQPDVHCKCAEYAPPHGRPLPERGVVEAGGGRVVFLPLSEGMSTTKLIRRMQALEQA